MVLSASKFRRLWANLKSPMENIIAYEYCQYVYDPFIETIFKVLLSTEDLMKRFYKIEILLEVLPESKTFKLSSFKDICLTEESP